MPAPTVTGTPNKSTYTQGEPITITVVATDVPNTVTNPRSIRITGTDEEGNQATVTVTVNVQSQDPESFTITDAKWTDTNQPLQVNGLQVSGTA